MNHIIKVKKITLIEKDIIEVSNKQDFEKLNLRFFEGGFILDLNGVWYLIGTEVIYTFNTMLSKKTKEIIGKT